MPGIAIFIASFAIVGVLAMVFVIARGTTRASSGVLSNQRAKRETAQDQDEAAGPGAELTSVSDDAPRMPRGHLPFRPGPRRR